MLTNRRKAVILLVMTIEEKLKELPSSSGVYLMYDKYGNVIYVGKAVVLKNRVRQYFHSTEKPPKVKAMVENVADFGYIITLSEKDALVLESNLVKKYNPRYNILLKDDKASPYIKMDLRAEFPSVEVTRKLVSDGARYFGPYLNGLRVWDIVAIIRSVYHIRTCPKNFRKRSRECLDYHIGLCDAPCMGRISREDYAAEVAKTIEFLSGREDTAEAVLTQKMTAAAEKEDFERAITYREQLFMIKKLKERNVSDLKRDDDIDSFALASDGKNAAVSVNIVRGGKMMGVKNFIITDAGLSADDTLSSFIAQFYANNPVPKTVCFHGEFDAAAVVEYLTALRGDNVEVLFPQRGIKRKLTTMAEENAKDYLVKAVEKERRIEDMTVGAADRLAKLLKIRDAKRIECYDISNISGVDKVASEVVFIDGAPAKSEYRRYRIRTVEGANDFASMHEVLQRRLKKSEPPSLIVIDGGKGQLKSALEAAAECGVSVNMVSLAKREEIICTPDGGEIALSKSDYALRLLQRVRDEAHRFAITYHRSLRGKRMQSELLQIKGVGEVKRKKLSSAFTIKELSEATAEEIAEKAGIDATTAAAVEEYFKAKRKE